MKQMERSKVIAYRWWRPGGEDIKSEHVEALEEKADDIIAEMMPQGFTSGRLSDHIRMTDDDPPDGVAYDGWWEVTEKRTRDTFTGPRKLPDRDTMSG